MTVRPVATDQALPSICPLGEQGLCGDMGVKRERRWGSPRLTPRCGKGRRAGHQRVGRTTARLPRPGGLCQDKPDTVRTMGSHVHFLANRSHYRAKAQAYYMTKGGPIKEVRPPLIKAGPLSYLLPCL